MYTNRKNVSDLLLWGSVLDPPSPIHIPVSLEFTNLQPMTQLCPWILLTGHMNTQLKGWEKNCKYLLNELDYQLQLFVALGYIIIIYSHTGWFCPQALKATWVRRIRPISSVHCQLSNNDINFLDCFITESIKAINKFALNKLCTLLPTVQCLVVGIWMSSFLNV